MKNIYTIFLTIAFSSALFAQSPFLNYQKLEKKESLVLNYNNNLRAFGTLPQPMASGDTIWYDGFDNPANWSMNSAAPNGWRIGTTTTGWFLPAINSTSGGNFAEMENGNPATGTPAPQNGPFNLTTVNAIDISGYTNITLRFQQYTAMFQDVHEVQISTDGVSFVPVGDNSDIEPLTQSGGAPTSNPMLRGFNITNYFTPGSDSLWIRFEWRMDAQNITYGWLIDDVHLIQTPDHVMDLTDANFDAFYSNPSFIELEYTQYPLTQAMANPLTFEGVFLNSGAADQTNTRVFADVDFNSSNVFSDSSAMGFSIAWGSNDTVATAPTYTASQTGNYSVNIWGGSDSIPSLPTTFTKSFMVTDSVYARDAGTAGAGNWDLGNSCGGFETGNIMDVYADQTATSISAYFMGSQTSGGTVKATIYDAADFVTVIAESNYHDLLSTQLNGWVSLPLTSPTLLTAGGSYMIVVGGFQSTADSSAVATSGSVRDQTSYLHDIDNCFGGGSDTWYYVTSAPMVRLNFSICGTMSSSTNVTDASASGATDASATVTASGGTSPYTYMWDNGAGSQTTATATGLGEGTYSVTVSDANGCSSTSNAQIIIMGLNDRANSDVVSVYPNPVSGNLWVEASFTGSFRIDVLNLNGELVYSKVANNNKEIIDTDSFSKGSYLVKVSQGNFIETRSIVVK